MLEKPTSLVNYASVTLVPSIMCRYIETYCEAACPRSLYTVHHSPLLSRHVKVCQSINQPIDE